MAECETEGDPDILGPEYDLGARLIALRREPADQALDVEPALEHLHAILDEAVRPPQLEA